jgi:hypothetical protein
LDRVLNNYALDFYAKHLSKIQINAIGSLAGEGGAGAASSGKPVALPAGQAAGHDQELTNGL